MDLSIVHGTLILSSLFTVSFQTNVQNNNNKYFIIQLLKDDNKNAYSVWFRWGRVGLNGQNNLISCGPDLEEAKKIFCKK